jgi:hypothetical protein
MYSQVARHLRRLRVTAQSHSMGIMPGGRRAWVSTRARGLAKRTSCAINSLEFKSLLFHY